LIAVNQENTEIYVPGSNVTALMNPDDSVRISVLDGSATPVILEQEFFGDIVVPLPKVGDTTGSVDSVSGPGMVVLPLTGGRGPIVNYGETITTGILLAELSLALSEPEFTVGFNSRLNGFDSSLSDHADDLSNQADDIAQLIIDVALTGTEAGQVALYDALVITTATADAAKALSELNEAGLAAVIIDVAGLQVTTSGNSTQLNDHSILLTAISNTVTSLGEDVTTNANDIADIYLASGATAIADNADAIAGIEAVLGIGSSGDEAARYAFFT